MLVQTLDGRYLTGEGEAWTLTNDWAKAAILDFPALHLADKLKTIPNAAENIFVLVPFDAFSPYETCDRCGRRVRSWKTFFDGRQFLCPQCRTDLVSGSPPSGRSSSSRAVQQDIQ